MYHNQKSQMADSAVWLFAFFRRGIRSANGSAFKIRKLLKPVPDPSIMESVSSFRFCRMTEHARKQQREQEEQKMAYEEAFAYLEEKGYGDRVSVFDVSSATVELAALAVGTEPARIAKSLSFLVNEKPVMIICAGDAKISNSKYKGYFHKKAKMLTAQEVHDLIGHDVGGVCPFGIKDGVDVYLDVSLKRFEKVYPACGSSNSAVELTPEELEQLSGNIEWIDVCV